MNAFRPYRPSNGTESEIFMGQFCYRCKRDNNGVGPPCEVLMATMGYDVDEPEYPSDTWVYFNGEPTCLAFIDNDEGDAYTAAPDDPAQLDLFLELPTMVPDHKIAMEMATT